ncbi:MAG: mevalonate kinase [Bacteroidetes bacterium]|nr:mevalonate kinase [Bacteroidota bacterium]
MKIYPAKLLLFGEHTVNTGSQALAVPLPLFHGHWAYAKKLGQAELALRQMQLPQFAAYLERLQRQGELLAEIDVAAFRQALGEGLVFESNIPTGYGVGSSGALAAAVLGDFGIGISDFGDSEGLAFLKKALAQMEAFFHGTSSGTDPLICFLQKPILLGGAAGVQIVEIPTNSQFPIPNSQMFLLDTGIERKATPFIEYFLEKMRGEGFRERCKNGLLPAVEAAIAAFLAGDGAGLFDEMHRIGEFQFRFLRKMIPEKFHSAWQAGLNGGLLKLKICGAGGGGFLLGMTTDLEELKPLLPGFKILPVFSI